MNDKTDREIMQQALKALEVLTDNYDDNAVGIEIDAIIALRKRLAQPEQKPVLQDIEQYRMQMASISTAAIGYWKECDGIHPDYDTPALRDVAMLYAKYDALYKAQPDQEPVVVIKRNESGQITMQNPNGNHFDMFKYIGAKLYATPQKREWQGLTDEDVRDLWSWSMTAEAERTANTQQHAFALAVAAKLKEKND